MTFADIAAARSLYGVARGLGNDATLVLRRTPTVVRRVLALAGWNDQCVEMEGMSRPHAVDGSHRALVYDDASGFVDGVAPFVREGLDAGARVLVATTPSRVDWLREHLGGDVDALDLADADALYAHHGRMFRRIVEYLERHAAPGTGGARIVAEQAIAARSPADIRAYLRYEAAANVVYDRFDVGVLCPYDAGRLPDEILADVHRTHPEVVDDNGVRPSEGFMDPRAFVRRTAGGRAVPQGVEPHELHRFEDLHGVRAGVRAKAAAAGLPPDAVEDLALAVNEIATNALVHGRAPRRLWSYVEDGAMVCRVRDAGPGPPDPLAGYLPPAPDRLGGRGLWVAHQVCDVVDIATGATGTDVVVHMSVGG